MEPSGRNRWQPEANRTAGQNGTNETVAVGCDELPRPQNGREGVDGFEYVRGLAKAPHVQIAVGIAGGFTQLAS